MATLSNFFLHYQTKAAFTVDKEAGKISDSSISFIKDTKEVYTHGVFYQCSVDLNLVKEQIQAVIVQDINDSATDKVVSQAVVKTAIEKVMKSLSESEVKLEGKIKEVSDKVSNIETVTIPEIKAYTVNGKVISTNPVLAKEDVGLGKVDNTADLEKPISTATQAALDKITGDLGTHTAAKNNPHEVTKEQVGLGNVTNDAQVKRSDMGVANGVATLDQDGKIPSAQLPGFVDDVLEFENKTAFPKSGEAGKIYVALDTNLTYRWGGSEYVEISSSLALGETSSTAFPGDRGKALEEKTNAHIANKENPHGVTKVQVGLDKVDNTPDAEKPVSTAQQAALDAAKKELTEKITAEETRATEAEKTINDKIDIINGEDTVVGSIKKGDKDTLEAAKKFASGLFTWYEGN